MPQGVGSNIIVCCSDPRVISWLHNKKVQKILSISDVHSEIADTGSIKYFLHERLMTKIYSQLEILIGHFGPKKIILLNHTDCGYYKSIGENKKAYYIKDLKNAKRKISAKFPQLEVEGWLIDTESGKLQEVK